MGFNRFRLQVVVRVLIMIALGFATVFVIWQTYFWLVSVWLGLLFILAIIEFIRFAERSKKALGDFLMSVKQGDFSTAYPKKDKRDPDHQLYEAITIINQEFKKVRQEREINYQYLKTIMEHTDVAMICYQVEDGSIQLFNKAAQILFDKPYLNSIGIIEKVDNSLFKQILELKSGQKKLLVMELNGVPMNLSVMVKEFKIRNKLFKLVTFKDVQTEIEETEVKSWQKLIRVLTHEIMNSAIPISTLAAVIDEKLEEKGKPITSLNHEEEEDLRGGIKTIKNRSHSLIEFIESYRTLTKLPEPEIESVGLSPMFQSIKTLLEPELKSIGVSFKIRLHNDEIKVKADLKMLEQVLINLIKNAEEAVIGKAKAEIILMGYQADGKVVIEVSDNGCGMDGAVLEEAFIPFYTTKKTGSGIGLSLSRQLIHLHKGSITLNSKINLGTKVTITLPN